MATAGYAPPSAATWPMAKRWLSRRRTADDSRCSLRMAATHALDNQCPHMVFPLVRGLVRNGMVTCDWHDRSFDLAGDGWLNIPNRPPDALHASVDVVCSRMQAGAQ